MNNREAEERLQYMLKRCDADGYCRYYTKEKGCDGCCEAVRIAVRGLEQEKRQQKWIPVNEKLPEDNDRRFFMCLVENHLEDPPMFCQYEEEYGFGFWEDLYDPVTLGFLDSKFSTMEELGYEKVLYWMPLIELPERYREDEKDE